MQDLAHGKTSKVGSICAMTYHIMRIQKVFQPRFWICNQTVSSIIPLTDYCDAAIYEVCLVDETLVPC